MRVFSTSSSTAARTVRSNSSAASPREGGDVVVGQPGLLADRHVFVPLVCAVGEMGDPQHGELTQARRQRRPRQQVEAEGEVGPGEVGVVDERRDGVARGRRIPALLGHHPQGAQDGVVPLVGRQRGQAHARSPLGVPSRLSEPRIIFSYLPNRFPRLSPETSMAESRRRSCLHPPCAAKTAGSAVFDRVHDVDSHCMRG